MDHVDAEHCSLTCTDVSNPGGRSSGHGAFACRDPAGREHLVWLLGALGVAGYNWWLVVPVRPGLLRSANELFSDLELAGQPLAWTLRGTDVLSGSLLLAAFALAGVAVGGRTEWRSLLAFAAAGAAGGVFPQACPDTVGTACRQRELSLALPASHYMHLAAGAAEFAAITVALSCAVRRTRGDSGLIPRMYRLLAAAAVAGYPLLAVSYLAGRLDIVSEAAFFALFSAVVLAELAERTSVVSVTRSARSAHGRAS